MTKPAVSDFWSWAELEFVPGAWDFRVEQSKGAKMGKGWRSGSAICVCWEGRESGQWSNLPKNTRFSFLIKIATIGIL